MVDDVVIRKPSVITAIEIFYECSSFPSQFLQTYKFTICVKETILVEMAVKIRIMP